MATKRLDMKDEIRTACRFIYHMLKKGCRLSEHQLQQFTNKMQDVLSAHFRHHWHLENPQLGSAYRCIRINHIMDPLVVKAARECGVKIPDLSLPKEFTMWIDPSEISYRFGEDGSINTVSMKEEKNENISSFESMFLNRGKSQSCGMNESKVNKMNSNISVPECVSS